MDITVSIVAALAVVAGLIGIVVPVLPGLITILVAVVIWALVVQSPVGWVVLIISLALAAAGWMLQYMVPAKRLQTYGVPKRTLLIGGIAGVFGLFLLPPVGLPIGFVLGVFGSELARQGSTDKAWPAAVEALKAAALSYGIELTTGVLIAIAFGAGVAGLLAGSGAPAGTV